MAWFAEVAIFNLCNIWGIPSIVGRTPPSIRVSFDPFGPLSAVRVTVLSKPDEEEDVCKLLPGEGDFPSSDCDTSPLIRPIAGFRLTVFPLMVTGKSGVALLFFRSKGSKLSESPAGVANSWICRSFLRGSSPKCFQNLTKEVLFAFLFALSIRKLWAVMVLLQRLEPGLQSVHGTLLMAQGQKSSEHEA